MTTGAIVGEVAFFAGGNRAADVTAGTSGYIAFIAPQHLLDLLKASPAAGCKLLRAFGASSLHQLTHNPQAHHPLQWNMIHTEVTPLAIRFQREHLDADVYGLDDLDVEELVASL